jgi:hypothetical protein
VAVNLKYSVGVNPMPTKKVEKGGVYRAKNGTALYLAEGAQVEEEVLAGLTLDQGATDKRNAPRDDAVYLGGTRDVPQDRMVSGAPENKAAPPPKKTEDK